MGCFISAVVLYLMQTYEKSLEKANEKEEMSS